MAAAVAMRGGSSDSGGFDKVSGMDSGKYVRYTPEQVEVLERLYIDCPKPSSSRRQQLLRECPILAHIEPKQIKVWFQNRRCRDKQRKESSRLQAVNRKLTAMNKLLMEENERLQKQVSQLVHENAHMRQQLQSTSLANDTSCESNVTTPPNPMRDASNPSGLLSIAEETFTEFLSKATGTAIDWVQMPGMKPGPDSVGIVAISHGCRGVAARACGLVNLEPTKVIEILKDRPSWFRDCRSLEVFTMFPAGNGGTIELVYMQMYAPTTLVPARDFWTLRYTTTMEDGSLVVCERSLSGSGGGPSAASAQQFVRAEMLPSGYLVRPCDGGGSIVHIVDHLDLEAWSVPEVLRPLYESSRVVAQKMTTVALRHLRQIAQETSGEVVYALGRQPAVLRTFSQRLSRGFNDAISGFNDDGWSIMGGDGIEDVVVACNSTKKIRNNSNAGITFGAPGGIICANDRMPDRDLASWNAMILALANHGRVRDSLDLFHRMTHAENITPNAITFVAVLSACNHGGLVDEGRRHFSAMTEQYEIRPRIEHYGCMVDILARAGFIEEALDVVSRMDCRPDSIIWRSLLDACCKKNAGLELSEAMAKLALDVPDDAVSGVYVLLSRVYASAQRWNDVGMIRRLMNEDGYKKEPGFSSIEMDGSVHQFVAGDTSHPQSEEIYEKLDEIQQRLTSAGYKPDLSEAAMVAAIDCTKGAALRLHSERLAISFGLLNASPGAPIRILKNLRVCKDCHTISKLISRLYDVEIIVRDRIRFHHFKDGSCSCNDYW